MAWFVYQLALALLLVVAAPFLALRRGARSFTTFPARLLGEPASVETPADEHLWVHAVSVGEVGAAVVLARAFSPGIPLVVTTITPTGLQEACRQLGDRARTTYLPLDFDFSIRRFLRRYRPCGLVLVEGDLWPLVLHRARSRQLPVVVVNGRISERNFRRLRWLPGLRNLIFDPVRFFGVQSEQDRERLESLGVDGSKISVTGNLKFESAPPVRRAELEDDIAACAAGRAIVLAGSTMAGEEEGVLEAFRRLGPENAMLVLAPRHPRRFDEVADTVERHGLSLRRRSAGTGERGAPSPDVFVLDSLGELASLYAIARTAFIGGTLVDTGGHNPLEAARFGVPIVVGPSMHNFPEMSRLFDDAAAWLRITGPDDLAAAWQRFLSRPDEARVYGERGRLIVEENGGAVERTLEILESHLEIRVGSGD